MSKRPRKPDTRFDADPAAPNIRDPEQPEDALEQDNRREGTKSSKTDAVPESPERKSRTH